MFGAALGTLRRERYPAPFPLRSEAPPRVDRVAPPYRLWSAVHQATTSCASRGGRAPAVASAERARCHGLGGPRRTRRTVAEPEAPVRQRRLDALGRDPARHAGDYDERAMTRDDLQPMGELAGTIAHDLNNLLAVIWGYD